MTPKVLAKTSTFRCIQRQRAASSPDRFNRSLGSRRPTHSSINDATANERRKEGRKEGRMERTNERQRNDATTQRPNSVFHCRPVSQLFCHYFCDIFCLILYSSIFCDIFFRVLCLVVAAQFDGGIDGSVPSSFPSSGVWEFGSFSVVRKRAQRPPETDHKSESSGTAKGTNHTRVKYSVPNDKR